jgi:hypothetical protein
MKAKIEIKNYHSSSDVITNSSSEIFCAISSLNKDVLYGIVKDKLEDWVDAARESNVYEEDGKLIVDLGYDESRMVWRDAIYYLLNEMLGDSNYDIEFYD